MPDIVKVFGEWDVVLVIVALVAFVKVFMDVSSNWTKAVTELNVVVKQLTKCVDEFKDSNAKTHECIFEQLEEHDDTLSNHDKRISILEEKEK